MPDQSKPLLGRPQEFNPSYVEKAQEYLALCVDTEIDGKLVNVKVPTKGGLAFYLNVARDTLYDWATKYPAFSDIMERLGEIQEERLINNGLRGTYNPTIAKVLLTKHGYREGLDQTSNGKDLIPKPIMDVQDNNSNQEG